MKRPDTPEPVPLTESRRWALSRRHFLESTAVGLVVAGALSGCSDDQQAAHGVVSPADDLTHPFSDVPGPPATPPDPSKLQWLRPDEARTLDALVATILPGSPDDPGAREAGVVTYIDAKLASTDSGLPDRHYSAGPHAKTVPTGQALPAPTSDHVYVPENEVHRYGPQSAQTAREQYRAGLVELDGFARSSAGAGFADLPPDRQELVVGALADDTATGFDEPKAQDFFNLVRGDVVEGMFGDPAYGGNRGLVGWILVGYPGAQRAYTPDDVQGRAPEKAPQGMAQMPHFHPGADEGANVVLPVSGARQGHESGDDQGR